MKKIDEARPRDLGLRDQVVRRSAATIASRELARIRARGLGEAHRDAGREVAVRDVAAALDRGIRRRRVAGSVPGGSAASASRTSFSMRFFKRAILSIY